MKLKAKLPIFAVICFAAYGLFPIAASSEDIKYLGERHVSEFGVECSGCHKEEPPSNMVESKVCESCHGSLEDIGKNTVLKDLPNPHVNHNEELYCEDCHHAHKPPEIFCGRCHEFNFKVP